MELYVKSREDWREWLEMNHQSVDEVWLIYYKKRSGKSRIPYQDAVEEALCFGWIDGKIKRVNDDYYMQRFTPRRQGSKWSRHNMEIVRNLIAKKQMGPAGLLAYEKALKNPGLIYDNRAESNPDIPVDLLKALDNGTPAFDNFMNFPQSGRRMFIYWLNSSKKTGNPYPENTKDIENGRK